MAAPVFDTMPQDFVKSGLFETYSEEESGQPSFPFHLPLLRSQLSLKRFSYTSRHNENDQATPHYI